MFHFWRVIFKSHKGYFFRFDFLNFLGALYLAEILLAEIVLTIHRFFM